MVSIGNDTSKEIEEVMLAQKRPGENQKPSVNHYRKTRRRPASCNEQDPSMAAACPSVQLMLLT